MTILVMGKYNFEHPALEQIAGTPDVLRWAMSGLTEEQTVRKPAGGGWSVAEVLEHLSHVENHYFRAGLDAVLEGGVVEPYDQEAYAAAGVYTGRDPEESFAHWEEQRDDNVELIREKLDPAALKKTARHPELGAVTAVQLLNEWAMHDLGHVRQILELVRAGLYYPELGPFQPQYRVEI